MSGGSSIGSTDGITRGRFGSGLGQPENGFWHREPRDEYTVESRAPSPGGTGGAPVAPLARIYFLSLASSLSFCTIPALRACSCISSSSCRAASSACCLPSTSLLYCASSLSNWAELRRRAPASP